MITPELLSAYRFHRANLAAGIVPPSPFNGTPAHAVVHKMAPALVALIYARADLDRGEVRYWSPFNDRANGFWKGRGTDKMQWVERPEMIGLRKVDYADQIYRGIDHTGWFTDDDGLTGNQLRGVVYRLPARNGIPQFVAGFDEYDSGNLAIDFGTIYQGERTENSDGAACDAARAAARTADGLAEAEAEERRDYNRAWQAGSLWSDLGDEIAEARATIKALLAERRAAKAMGADVPTICRTLRDYVADALEAIAEKRRDRKKLASGDYDKDGSYLGFFMDAEMRAAFNDGANEVVLA